MVVILAMAALTMNSVGCATIEYQKAGSTERILSTRQVPEHIGFVPEVSQDGTLVRARLTTDCHVRPYETVETTTHFEAVNTTPERDWAFGIGGALLAGLGVWGVIDARNTYENDVHSRTYNPVGSDASMGSGVAALVVGGALLAVAGVDVVLAMQGKSESSREELAREVGAQCPGTLLQNAEVTLTASLSGQQIVAPTDPNGMAIFDLQEVRSPSGPVTIGVPNGKGIETKEVAVNWAPVASQRKASEAAASKTAWERARQEQGMETAFRQQRDSVVRQLDAWARSVTAAWSSTIVGDIVCVNRVGVQVPCDGAAAFERVDHRRRVWSVTLRNMSSLPILCGKGATISPGKAHVFNEGDLPPRGIWSALGFDSRQRIACAAPTQPLSRVVTGASGSDFDKDGNIFFTMVTGDSSIEYVFATKTGGTFRWDGSTVVSAQ